VKPFTLTVVYEIFDFVGQQNRIDRTAIRKAFDLLKESPHRCRDLVEKDDLGRDYFIHLTGKFAIKFWIDEWEHEVKVIYIRTRDPR